MGGAIGGTDIGRSGGADMGRMGGADMGRADIGGPDIGGGAIMGGGIMGPPPIPGGPDICAAGIGVSGRVGMGGGGMLGRRGSIGSSRIRSSRGRGSGLRRKPPLRSSTSPS
jgi:hypothetical protein